MHFAILVGGTGPTVSIAAVAGRVAHLWRATTRVRVPLPVPRGGCVCWDKIKLSERAQRVVSNFVEVLGWVSLVRVHYLYDARVSGPGNLGFLFSFFKG